MQKMYSSCLLLLFLLSNCVMGNAQTSDLYGTYGRWELNGDAHIKVELRADSTFSLLRIDPLRPYTFDTHTNTGRWVLRGDRVILNPKLKPRTPVLTHTFDYLEDQDSFAITINFTQKIYRDNVLESDSKSNFHHIYLKIDKVTYHVVDSSYVMPSCAMSGPMRHVIKSNNGQSFKVSRQPKTLALKTYGMDTFAEWTIDKKQAINHVIIDILQPIDEERMPRSRELQVKKNKLYYYKRNGKFDKMAPPLWKRLYAGSIPKSKNQDDLYWHTPDFCR